MGKVHLLAAPASDSGRYSGGSWVPGLSLSNLLTQQPTQVARSTDATATSTQFSVDLKSSQSVTMFALIAHNFSTHSSVQLRVSNNLDGSSPSLNVTIDGVPGGATIDPQPGGQVTFYKAASAIVGRYVFVNITDTNNTDGYVQLGRFMAGEAFTPIFNAAYGAGLGFVDESILKRTIGGQVYANRKPIRRRANFALDMLTEDEAYGTLYEIQHSLGLTGNLLYVYDPDDDDDIVLRRTLYGTLTSLDDIVTANASPDYPYAARFTIEELLAKPSGTSTSRVRAPVANTSGIPDFGNSIGGSGFTVTSRHRLITSVGSLELVFPNFKVNSETGYTEGPVGNAITISCTLEDANGNMYPALFTGSTTGTIADGGVGSGFVTAGLSPQFFKLHTTVTPVGGVKVPMLTTTLDHVSGERTSVDPWIYRPIAIRGYTTERTFALVGDSRILGVLDTPGDYGYDGSGDLGIMAKAIGPRYAYTNLGTASDTTTRYITSHGKRVSAASGCTDVIVCFTNDAAGGGPSAAAWLVNLQTILTYFQGPTVWLATVPPYGVPSTDNWTTLGNQTAITGTRTTLNNLLRAGVTGASILELADTLESSRDSGKWRVDLGQATYEGIHELAVATHAVGRASEWTPVVGAAATPLTDVTLTWQPAYASGNIPKNTATGTTIADLGSTGGVSNTYVYFSESADTDSAIAVTPNGDVTLTRNISGEGNGTTHSFTVRATDYRGGTIDHAYTITVAASATVTAVLDPLHKDTAITLSGGNLTATTSLTSPGGQGTIVRATRHASTGKKFFSTTLVTSCQPEIGVVLPTFVIDHDRIGMGGVVSIGWDCGSGSSGNIFTQNSSVGFGGNSAVATSVCDVAIDLDAHLIWVRTNGGNWNNSGTANPATGTGGYSWSHANLNGKEMYPAVMLSAAGNSVTFNFGASAYTYAAPAGFGNW